MPSFSLELSFYIERRDDASFARAMHPNDWFIQHNRSRCSENPPTPEEFVELCDEIDRFSALDDCKDLR